MSNIKIYCSRHQKGLEILGASYKDRESLTLIEITPCPACRIEELLQFTQRFEDHPDDWDGPCECQDCREAS